MHFPAWPVPAGWLPAWEAAGARHSDSHHQSTLSPQLTVVLKRNYFPALLWIKRINHIDILQRYKQIMIGEIKMYHDGSIVLQYVVFPTVLKSIWIFIFRFSPNKHLAPIDKVWWCVLSTLCPVLRHQHTTCQ